MSMNARTSALLLLVSVCAGVTVLALLPSLWTDAGRAGAPTTQPHSAAPKNVLEGSAGPANLDVPDAPPRQVAPLFAHVSGIVAADADLDETTSPLETGCSTDEAPPASDATPRIAGSIRGSFMREGGPWTEENLPAEGTVILDLASIEHPTVPSVRARTSRTSGANGGIDWTFEFAEVPAGDYLLTLSALGTRRWSPTSLRVRPPLDGAVFTRFDRDPTERLAFEVFDAADGTQLTNFDARHIQVTPSDDNGVFLHTGPLDLSAFPLDARFQWSLRVEGYATAFGDDGAFVRKGERRIASVRLVRGWSTKIFVLTRDPTARPARAAEVLVDGVRAGFTGSDGMLIVSGATEPAAIDVKLAGFVRREGAASSGAYSARQRGGVMVVMLDRAP